MASSSTQKPSSSSAPTGEFNFDVFLSFRGKDTRNKFTDRLFEKLNGMGINTFRDDKLQRGEEIAQELLGSIEGSRFSIIVFSKNYADSKWCLDELAKIMECRKKMDQIVLPVFYHVDPSDVRKQKGSFGEAFANHEINVDEEKVKRWKAAMTEAGSLSGWHVIKDKEYESKPIEEIINHILKRLNPKFLPIKEHMVGMDVHLEELKSLLKMQLDDVRMVGIYGIGGIGKTTIAKMVYNDILCQFNGASFLEGVKNRSKCYSDQLQLLQELLHGIMEGGHLKLESINDGMNMIKGRLGSKKVLVVFDDVDDLDEVQRLVRSYEWFGPGSRIIITTRDKHLLDEYGVDAYEAKVLQDKEAIELFSWHAFKVQNIREDYVEMSNCMIKYAQGLPLALEVLGSSLYNKTKDEWKSAIKKLKDNPNRKINDVLKISLDGLDDSLREVFLDIACFFEGKAKDFILRILDDCAEYDIGVLRDRCLITISYKRVQMHDLIQQMGWAIVREKHPKDPSKWSRLWNPDDIHKALSAQEGMEQVEAISYDLSRSKEMQVNKQVFESMKKLRFLELHCGGYHGSMTKTYKVFLPKDFKFPSQELRYLYWEGYPLQTLPSNFNGENLVELHMRNSTIKQLWKGPKVLGKLKIIDLSGSRLLTKMPELSSMPNLEKLNLTFCERLKKFPGIRRNMGRLKSLHLRRSGIQEIPSSIEYLPALEVLLLDGCRNFDKFQDNFGNLRHLRFIHAKKADIKELPEIHVMKRLKHLSLSGTGIKELPNAFGCLEALKFLDLSYSNFEEFPEIQNMGSLRELFLNETAIKELPCSIGHLTELRHLNLENCKNLRSLPNSICGLKSLAFLDLNGCSNLVAFPEIKEDMEYLKELLLSKTPITELPPSIEHLKGLQQLKLKNCEKLVTLPNSIGNLTHLHSLCVRNCSKLHNLPDNLRSLQCCLETLDLAGCNLMEGAIPSDLWCLSSLTFLDVSESPIPCIPTNIIQLSNLRTLRMNHCQMLEEIPELPSRLEFLEARGCPHLGTLSTPSSPLWSSLLNLFKSRTQSCEYEIDSNSLWYFHVPKVVIPGSGGIPGWISHRSMGRQAIIELPKNRYEDNNFLGFAVFFHHVPLADFRWHSRFLQFELRISHDDQSERVIKIMSYFQLQTCRSYFFFKGTCYDNVSTSDPPLCVTYLPKFAIPSEHRYAKRRKRIDVNEVKICGIHLIYSKNNHQQNQSHGPEAMKIHIRKDQDISCDFQASPYGFYLTTRKYVVLQEIRKEGPSGSGCSIYYSADEGDPTVDC
ncbi:disease resistance protein RPV1-like isoform X2 [Vitis riparia]|uniref:disease resistance protein RPV1-like isoform X2 n=1 Tax=Vitis riparia TaxID=96939 RepID=UPI00155B211A|nr:disease resistance protein RPV1-like isoform X2 [Vitis riparia]